MTARSTSTTSPVEKVSRATGVASTLGAGCWPGMPGWLRANSPGSQLPAWVMPSCSRPPSAAGGAAGGGRRGGHAGAATGSAGWAQPACSVREGSRSGSTVVSGSGLRLGLLRLRQLGLAREGAVLRAGRRVVVER